MVPACASDFNWTCVGERGCLACSAQPRAARQGSVGQTEIEPSRRDMPRWGTNRLESRTTNEYGYGTSQTYEVRLVDRVKQGERSHEALVLFVFSLCVHNLVFQSFDLRGGDVSPPQTPSVACSATCGKLDGFVLSFFYVLCLCLILSRVSEFPRTSPNFACRGFVCAVTVLLEGGDNVQCMANCSGTT